MKIQLVILRTDRLTGRISVDVLVLNDDAVFLKAELGSLKRAKEDEYM